MGFPMRSFASLLLALAVTSAYGTVRVPAVFADHMVVQRGEPVHVWGDAEPGEKVTAEFRGLVRATTADTLGRWSVDLPQGDAGGPFTLLIRGNNSLAFHDVLVGDVWIASGQSNMGFALREAQNAQQEIAAANLPMVRLMNVNQRFASYPQDDVVVLLPWSVCTPATAAGFSAVGFFFARDLSAQEHVPIGVIESAWGGTPAEAWTSLSALSRDAYLMPVFNAWAAMVNAEPETARTEELEREAIRNKLSPGEDENLSLPWHPVFNAWAPAALYNGMIAPLTRFPIRGVIWYQGESNTDVLRFPVYARLFQTLIQDWRAAWSEGNFPFLFVQIANYRTGAGDHWPEIREAQRQALALANTAMAVTIDIGDPGNIHPANKQEVGHRLALAARAISYGEPIEYSGPLYRSMNRENGALRIFFDHAQSGLEMKGTTLAGFEISAVDGIFHPATARIEGTAVVLSASEVMSPVQARYGWSASPVCNLFNEDGLPAAPFRTQSQKLAEAAP